MRWRAFGDGEVARWRAFGDGEVSRVKLWCNSMEKELYKV